MMTLTPLLGIATSLVLFFFFFPKIFIGATLHATGSQLWPFFKFLFCLVVDILGYYNLWIKLSGHL